MHVAAVRKLHQRAAAAAEQQEQLQSASGVGRLSGISADVPRLDRFVAAATMLANGDSFASFTALVRAHELTSALPESGDNGRALARKLVYALAEPLRKSNLDVLSTTIKASVALDERDQVLLVTARCLTPTGLWDILLGLDRDFGFGGEAVAAAVRKVLRRACTRRIGRRESMDSDESPSDMFDQAVFDHFRQNVVGAVADGGPCGPQRNISRTRHSQA